MTMSRVQAWVGTESGGVGISNDCGVGGCGCVEDRDEAQWIAGMTSPVASCAACLLWLLWARRPMPRREGMYTQLRDSATQRPQTGDAPSHLRCFERQAWQASREGRLVRLSTGDGEDGVMVIEAPRPGGRVTTSVD